MLDRRSAAPRADSDGRDDGNTRGNFREHRRSLPLRLLIGAVPFLGALAILAILFRRIPPERLLAALAGADLSLFLISLLPVSALYVLLDTALLAAALRWFHAPGLSFRQAFAVRAVDYLVSLWNTRVSQAAMVGALGRVLGGPRAAAAAARDDSDEHRSGYWECAGTVLFLDLCQRAHLLLWAAGGAVALGSQAPDRVPVAAALGLTALGLLAAFFRGRLRRAGLGPPRWRLLRTLRSASAKRYLAVLAFKAPLIIATAIGHHFALRAFHIEIPPLSLLATLPIIFLAGALPIAVARVGTSQAAWLYLHAAAAAAAPGGEAALLAYSLSAHLTFLLANAALGAPFLPAAWRAIRAPERGPSLGSPWMSLNNPWIK